VALFPGLEISLVDGDLMLAVVDDYGPTAVEERDPSLLVFFPSAALRSQARAALVAAMPEAEVTDRDVDDEDWARRSQAGLQPVQVGGLTIWPEPPGERGGDRLASGLRPPDLGERALVVRPSMGFGTGHHATTRLCLTALQSIDLTGLAVLDVGTGSGILALAARRLGARIAHGIDCDADAIASARENLDLNQPLDAVTFNVATLGAAPLPAADVVTANLTGTLIVRSSDVLQGLVNADGHLIVSGLLAGERDAVRDAFGHLALVWERQEEEWVGLCLRQH
jgi:ribosomal protein L11 methyltransferase